MKRRAIGMAYAVVVAFVMQQFIVALPLAVASWDASRPLLCDIATAPYGAWSECLMWVSMARWGAQ